MADTRSGASATAILSALFAAVLATPAAADPSVAPSGRDVYERWCAACHDAGANHPGTRALAAKYQGATPAALLERTDLPAATVKVFVRNGVSVMTYFRKTEISDAQLDALADFLSRNTRQP